MDHRSVTGESKWNSKRRRLVLRVFNSTTDRGYGTLDAAGLGNAVSASALTLAGSDNGGGRSESFIGRLVAGDCESSPFYRRSELTGQPGTTFCNKQPQKSTGTLKNTRIDSNAWWGDDRRRNDGILCESRLLRLNSSGNGGGNNNNVPSRSYNLPTERDGRVGLIGSNSDFRKGNLKRNSLPDKYWNSGRILGYLDNVKFRNNEINKTHADRKKVTDLQFDPLFLPRLNGLDRDLDPRGVAVALDEGGQFSYYYVPDRFVSRDRSRDRVTMDSFPPPTPEDLKFLSAKHFLRKLKKEKQEVDLLRRKYGEPEEEGGTGVPEVDSKAHDDRLGTASTGSTGSTATVYLIRTVKKSSLGPNGGNRPNHHGNGGKVNDLEHSMPYKRRNVGNNLRREIVLEPVQIARNDGDRRKPGEGQARDTVEGQQARTRTTKTKRVKDSTAQTNDLYSTERYAEVSAVPMKVIVPRRPKRTIGLQTAANQSELFDDDDATVTSSSGRRSIGVQTTSHPIVSKTSTETQTTDGDDVTRRRHQKRTRDFGVQTETDSKEIEETEKTVTSQERERRTSNVPDAPLVDLSMASDVTSEYVGWEFNPPPRGSRPTHHPSEGSKILVSVCPTPRKSKI